jgi:DNA-binding SARP family transcriptional activator/tetratricopeptide (TPR) repeat protein
VRFEVLGPLRVVTSGAGEPVLVSASRLRVVLAVLLWRVNQPVTVDELSEMAWDGAPPAGASATMRGLILRLRRALGPQAGARIVTRAPGYVIELAGDELDASWFVALGQDTGDAVRAGDWVAACAAAERAMSLWRGAALLDVPCRALREAWLSRLDQHHLQVRQWHAEAGLHLGQHERLIPALADLVTHHPLNEHFRAQLMTALARSGRQAEALEAYRDARRVLVGELGIEPGPALRSVHQRILSGQSAPAAALPGEEGGPAGGSASQVAAAPVVPRQLPAAPWYFTGREKELDRLAVIAGGAGAQAGTVVISAIDGMAGIGKTALAVHAAHRLAGRFPDGQLFLDLHGYTQGHPPRTASGALEWLLQALGVPPEGIPPDGEQAAALYRQRLAGTRTLIVLDNAAHEAQVRPLLPGGGSCLVLVTSRRRLKALDDAQLVSLDLLSPPDAVALLRAVAGPGRIPAGDPLAGEVAGLCGYLPLALRIAASLLRHRPAWSMEHLAGQLRDQHQRVSALSDGERELEAVFDLSYASLQAPHRRLWRLLGLIPGPDLDAYAAAALAGADLARAAGLLEDLVDHSLLAEYTPGRYRLHDLLRAHARALAGADPAPEREAAVDRLLHYYAHTAQKASVPIARTPMPVPDGPAPAHAPALPGPESARTWLRTEQPSLEAAFTHARSHGLDGHVISLAAGLAEILLTDGPWARALDIRQAAADTAGRLGRLAAHAGALTDLGRVRTLIGDYPGAGEALTRALKVCRALGNPLGEAGALTSLGRVRGETGDYPGAGEALTRALEVYRALGNPLGEASALTDLARLRQATGDYPGAGDALTRALEIYDALSHRHGQANALTELGRVRHLTGDYPGAGEALTRALEVYRALGNRLGEANALTDLGRVTEATGDYPGAGDVLAQALELYRALGNRNGEAYALTNLGHVRHLAGDYARAGNALTGALEIYQALGNRGNKAWALNYYAATLAASGQRTRALALYQQALAMNHELNKPDDEAVSLEGIAEHHLAAGDPAQGTACLHQALEIYQRLGMAPDTHRVQNRLTGLTPR